MYKKIISNACRKIEISEFHFFGIDVEVYVVVRRIVYEFEYTANFSSVFECNVNLIFSDGYSSILRTNGFS